MAGNPYADLIEKNPYAELIRPPLEAPQPGGSPNSGIAGMANLGANIAGLPMETVKNLLNLGIAGYGSAATALGRSDLAPNLVQRLPGDIENAKGMLRSTGVPLLSPDNPNPKAPVGTFAYDMASRGGFMPGGVLPAVSSIVGEKIGGPQWGAVASLLPQAATSTYNALRAPSLAKEESLNAVRDKTLTDAQEAGYVVPPSAVKSSFVNKRLESVAGKAAIGQESAARNQEVTNALARKEVGLPEDQAISVSALNQRRTELSAPYRQISKIDPEVASAVKDLKQARYEANNHYRFYDVHPNPEVLAKAKQFDMKADQIESFIEDAAKNAGKPGLVDELRQARADIAKTWDVQRALNKATGDVSAPVLGSMFDKGKPLTGNLSTIGRFQQAFPQYAREGEKIPTPGVSKSEALAAAALSLGGFGAMGPYGAALGMLPFASGPVRSMLLSGPYQKQLAPSYRPILTESQLPMTTRLGILSQPQMSGQ